MRGSQLPGDAPVLPVRNPALVVHADVALAAHGGEERARCADSQGEDAQYRARGDGSAGTDIWGAVSGGDDRGGGVMKRGVIMKDNCMNS